MTDALAILAMLISPIAFVDAAYSDPLLFVAATHSNSVAVIDPSTNLVTGVIPVGHNPIRITMTLHDPDGKLEAGRQFQFVVDLPKQVH